MSRTPENDAPPELYCVELRTKNWRRLVGWYRHAIGLRSLLRVDDDQYALLVAGPTRLAIVGRAQSGEPTSRWSLAFEVSDLDAAEARLAGAGTDYRPRRLHPEGFLEISTSDPDGNRVRLFTWPRQPGSAGS